MTVDEIPGRSMKHGVSESHDMVKRRGRSAMFVG